VSLEEKVERWVTENVAKYCPKCPNTCCDPKRHVITLNSEEVVNFNNMPNYWSRDFSWMKKVLAYLGIKGPLTTKDNRKILKPATIQLLPYGEVILYSDKCPNLDEEHNKCDIHFDELKPNTCRKYPAQVNSKYNSISLKTSCYAVNQEEFYLAIQKRFKLRKIILV